MSETNEASLPSDPLDHLLGYQLRRAAFAVGGALVAAFGELGLNITEATLIQFVRANPGCTQASIGRTLGVQRANLVPLINGLMTKDLIERTAADGRSHSLYLTGHGLKVHRKIVKAGVQHDRLFFGDLSDDERQSLMRLFRSLRRKGERPDEPVPVGAATQKSPPQAKATKKRTKT